MALKRSSEQIQISTVCAAPTGFAVTPVDLQLNPLDNEVFVVTAINMNFHESVVPSLAVKGVFSQADQIAVSTTRPASQLDISDSNCLAHAIRTMTYGVSDIDGDGAAPFNLSAVAIHEQKSSETPPANMDRIGIIATSDFFVGCTNGSPVGVEYNVRVYGYRAKADAATYAALVQSEVLSA